MMAFIVDPTQTLPPSGQPRPAVRVWGWAILAVLPFLSLNVAQYVRGPGEPTGFICYDLPYYVANGREIFERGNGIGYGNPYDPAPAPPVIYYHLLSWVFGCGVSLCGIPPAVMFLSFGCLAAVLFAYGTFRLVEGVLPSDWLVPVWFLLSMWGGGLLVLSAIVINLAGGETWAHDIFRLDPHDGWWFLNWGRNSVFPTEAAYHALAVQAWLGAVTRRPWRSVAAVGVLAATHPFSGIQQILIIGSWLSFKAFRDRSARPPLAMLGLVGLVFGGYYFGYLPRFPEHRRIFAEWSLDWNLPAASMAAAYGPVAALAATRCWRDRRCWRPEMTFLLVAVGVSLVLAKHELFVMPRQPLHFTRGYIWMPLWLLGLPLVQRLGAWATRWAPAKRVAAVVLGCGLFCSDNAAWLADRWRDNPDELRTSSAVLDIFRQLDRRKERGVAVTFSKERDNYLLATFTQLDPFYGHVFLCPDWVERGRSLAEWIASASPNEWIDDIEVLILSKHRRYPIDTDSWDVICENAHFLALRRRR
jgi:hypothetical protein